MWLCVGVRLLILGIYLSTGNGKQNRLRFQSERGTTLLLCVYIMPVCMSVCLFVCLSVCLSVCVSVCLSVCLPVFLSVCLSVCLDLQTAFFTNSGTEANELAVMMARLYTGNHEIISLR